MKGITWNGSYFASKGSSRSEGRGMISVGDLVAFPTSSYCSPDGRQYRGGCEMMTSKYFLQHEIELEEFDRTRYDGYGGGKRDVQTVVELSDVFRHKHYTHVFSKEYLCAILATDQPQFEGAYLQRIEKVRENEGHFLHVYELNEAARIASKDAKSFAEAVQLITAEKSARDDAQTNWAGSNMTFGIHHRGGWYKPSASLGHGIVRRSHGYDDSSTTLYNLRIAQWVRPGHYYLYINSIPVSLHLEEFQRPRISVLASNKLGNQQNWWYDELERTNISKGMFYIDSADAYPGTLQNIRENQARKRQGRQERFEAAKQKAEATIHPQEVIDAALRLRGKTIASLEALAEYPDLDPEQVIKALGLMTDVPQVKGTLTNLLQLIAEEVDPSQASRLIKRMEDRGITAKRYMTNVFPGLTGKQREMEAALRLYAENWQPGWVYESYQARQRRTPENGDLAVKLRQAFRKKEM